MDTFNEQIDHLIDAVGRGRLRAHLMVNQAYAQNQHETVTFVHRHGGGPHYLSEPLMASYPALLQNIADKTITEHGSDIVTGMIETAEAMSQMVADNAPGDGADDDLRRSGHPTVDRDGIILYDRPPLAPRRPEGMPHT
jgi:hypothetical protein